ncbi:unnamed protein product [Echinostoma caproni]|uniref:Reverse transcriptase domain-containing protein n=1 Tax=Echinostoma caproni TaxID=27848 RepID=A0A183A8W3_9TREM|nr:unnamed protein product [Echinostoma caproni]
MKVPWPAAFEDGDVRMFLEELEDVVELAGIRTDRGKLTTLRWLLKGSVERGTKRPGEDGVGRREGRLDRGL